MYSHVAAYYWHLYSYWVARQLESTAYCHSDTLNIAEARANWLKYSQ